MTQELKPCPFCGGEAELMTGNVRGKRYAWCECLQCGVATLGYYNGTEDERIKQARDMWNRRADDGDN